MEKNQAINGFKMEATSKDINCEIIAKAVGTFVAFYNQDPETIADIKTSIREAINNCIEFAYPESVGTICVSVKLYPNGKFVAKIKDKGCGIESVEKAREPLYTTGNEEHSGLGFSVMESFSDNVKVKSTVGKGTTVILEKQLEFYQ